ncbi:MAG: sulfite exporter TauE/SafE family protein [Deltaproteobacteria bacterium]|nr:sulfite exporter TauE/SafE family protein [Deltaproteobacteria bacterium]
MGIYTLIFSCCAILSAGIIRGYSGFGFSMVAVVSLSLVMTPAEIVPVILVFEVVASLWLLPKVWRQIHWRSLSWLSIGVLIGTPAGVYLLTNISPNPMRAAIAVVVMVLVILLWRGFSLKTIPGRGKSVVTGLVSGVLNGSATIGGPPVILFYLSTSTVAAVSRASLIAFFLGTDILAFVICLTQGLVTSKTGIMCVSFLLPLLLGLGVGNHFFNRSKADAFREKVLILLMALAVIALARAILQ